MSEDAAVVAATYFKAWNDNDFATLRSILADDVVFDGPLAHIDNAEECVKGLEGMSKIKTRIDIKKVFVDGADVLTWFDLHTSVAAPIPTANWSHVVGGLITRIQVAFDARSVAPPPAEN